ncbi:hypothetical protein E2562_013106 [Oryza meyeriana var. granulata]|uniref:Uncharacterized protein n=1 Tax=Oryza meyeriana var. granulata TaxID=110450 RepID=A0A6G1F7K5_9ORYZ|nr:hypothetical protein E2562_013106 [Oryza meyeriana var. granulata]
MADVLPVPFSDSGAEVMRGSNRAAANGKLEHAARWDTSTLPSERLHKRFRRLGLGFDGGPAGEEQKRLRGFRLSLLLELKRRLSRGRSLPECDDRWRCRSPPERGERWRCCGHWQTC